MTHPGFDTATLLRITGGNTSLAEELIGMLLHELPKHRAEIHRAYDAGDLVRLAEHAHTLYGGCAYCGALSLKSLSGALEHLAKSDAQQHIKQAIAALDTEIDRVLAL